MPSTPPSARSRGPRRGAARRGAAILAAITTLLLGTQGTMLLGPAHAESIAAPPAASLGADHRGPSRPALPPNPASDGLALDLISLGTGTLAPGEALTAEVAVTNGTGHEIAAPRLALSSPTPRVTSRSDLEAWQQDTSPDAGGPVASSPADAPPLAPGEVRTMSVTVPAADLRYAMDPSLWGARRVALTVTSGGADLATLRTFVVWRPAGTTAAITTSVLLPLSAADPGSAALDPAAFEGSASTGRLASLARLAQRPDVDWLLDPALLDPPVHEPSSRAQAAAAQGGPASADPATTSPAAADAASKASTSPAAQQLAETLVASVGDRTVLTLPYARADLPSLQAAGATGLERILEQRSQQALSTAGLASSGTVGVLPGAQADAATLTSAQRSGAGVLLTSSDSLREDPASSITPSSVGEVSTDAGTAPVLGADPVLSDELSSLDGATDTEQTTQRLLAETAVIASEPTADPRHILLAPPVGTDIDDAAAGQALDALDAAPWVHPGRTSALLQSAGSPGSLGTLSGDEVHPSARGSDGAPEHLAAPAASPQLDPTLVLAAQRSAERLNALRSTLVDPAPADDADLIALSAVSDLWLEDPTGQKQRTEAAARAVLAIAKAVSITPASSYTLVASGASVPITVSNDLDSPVRATLEVSADRPLVRLPRRETVVEVPARGRITASVPVEAVANGQVSLSVHLRTQDGTEIASPRTVSLTVNPSWENWTTLVLVTAMALLVVVGILRARRHGSDRRAPAMRGPEDPSTLARTGLSAPAIEDPAPPEATEHEAAQDGAAQDGATENAPDEHGAAPPTAGRPPDPEDADVPVDAPGTDDPRTETA